MKRWIHASEEVDEEFDWSPYSKGKYCVSSGYGDVKYTDNPKTAISYWYRMQKNNPMDVSISCQTRENAIKLCKAATEDFIYQLDEKYGVGPRSPEEGGYKEKGCPYMPQWIVDEAAKKVADGQKWFHEDEYGDTVHPFGVG